MGVVITARVKSSRLPEKVLSDIGGRKAIDILLANCRRAKYPIVLAFPDSPEDDVLAEHAKKNGVKIRRGSEKSPLHEMVAAAKENGFDHVVRITADDILIDPELLHMQVNYHLLQNADYTFCFKCIDGVAGEVIRVSSLALVAEKMKGERVEFISYYLKGGDWKVSEFIPPPPYRERIRLTMDHPEDLTVLRILCNQLRTPFSSMDIINFFREPNGYHNIPATASPGSLDILNFFRDERNKHVAAINKMPAVTVYTCCFNQGEYLETALKSIEAQWPLDIEVIVVDDHSSDGTSEVMLDWFSSLPEDRKKMVRLVRNEKNIGLPASCNKVLKMARGKYILRLDSDDVLERRALTRMIQAMNENYDAAAVFSGYYKTDKDLNVLAQVDHNLDHHPGGCLLLTRAAHECRFKEGLEFYEGREFFERFLKNYKHVYVKEPLWSYRQHSLSKTAERKRRGE